MSVEQALAVLADPNATQAQRQQAIQVLVIVARSPNDNDAGVIAARGQLQKMGIDAQSGAVTPQGASAVNGPPKNPGGAPGNPTQGPPVPTTSPTDAYLNKVMAMARNGQQQSTDFTGQAGLSPAATPLTDPQVKLGNNLVPGQTIMAPSGNVTTTDAKGNLATTKVAPGQNMLPGQAVGAGGSLVDPKTAGSQYNSPAMLNMPGWVGASGVVNPEVLMAEYGSNDPTDQRTFLNQYLAAKGVQGTIPYQNMMQADLQAYPMLEQMSNPGAASPMDPGQVMGAVDQAGQGWITGNATDMPNGAQAWDTFFAPGQQYGAQWTGTDPTSKLDPVQQQMQKTDQIVSVASAYMTGDQQAYLSNLYNTMKVQYKTELAAGQTTLDWIDYLQAHGAGSWF